MVGKNVLSRFRQEGGRLWVKRDEGNLRWNSTERLEGSGWIQNSDDWESEDAAIFFVGYLKKLQITGWTMKWKDSEGNCRWIILDSPHIWLEGNDENNNKFQSGQTMSWVELKSGTLRTQVVALSQCKTTKTSTTFINLCKCICM